MVTRWRCLFASAAVLASACGGSERPAPTTPTASVDARPADGSTLKIGAPTPAGPTFFLSHLPLTLTVLNAKGKYADFPVINEVEIRDASGTTVANPRFPAGSGLTSSYTLTTPLPGTEPYAWRVRATHGDDVGPWSAERVFTLERFVSIDGVPEYFDRATRIALKTTLKVTGFQFDCSDRTVWSVDNPSVATISPQGLLTGNRLGEVNVRASCDGRVATRTTRVVEVWQGELRITRCDGSLSCSPFNLGSINNAALVVTDDASRLTGWIHFQSYGRIPVSGGLNGAGMFEGSGELIETHCDSSQYYRVTRLRAASGSLSIEVRHAQGCAPTTSFDWSFTAAGELSALRR